MLRMIGVIADITARKQAEETVRESESRYRRIVETTNEGVWLLDSKFHTVFVNWQLAEMLGYDPVEIVGRSVFDFYFPEDVDRKRQILERRRQGLREHFDDRLRRRDGSELWVRLAGIPVFKDSGEFDGALAMVSDITERKRAEEALRESEGRFRLVANTAPVLIWMSGPDKLCNYFNQPWLEFTGRPVDAELGNGWAEGVHPEDLEACMDTYTQAFDQRESFQMEYRLRRHDGEYRWILDIGVPRFNADRSFAGYIGSCIDVTDHKLAEESLANIGRKLIEAHEEERTWIARELHDDITQRIALLAIELDRWNQHLPESAVDLHHHVHDARQRLSELAKDIQALSHRLHSSKLEYLGIAVAATSFCKELSEQQQVQVDFSHSDVPRTVPKEVALSLFRVLQEALQNAVKHSGVRHFKVELRGTPEEIHLTVTDLGIGFEWQGAMSSRGLGLISMRERLHLVTGDLSIKSEPGRGTTISARVPLAAEKHRPRMAG
jgi:PAS domain S-box-containing protein